MLPSAPCRNQHLLLVPDGRVLEHNGAKANGARYTSARRPVSLVFEAAFATRSDALKEEARIKRLTRDHKRQLIAAGGVRAKGS